MMVKTPSRVHFTLIDLNARVGRVDGGIGLALEDPNFEITVEESKDLLIEGPQRDRAFEAARRILDFHDLEGGARIKIDKAINPHIGLGSGTQLMLTVGTAISRLYGFKEGPRDIARIMGRGGTSGIGIAAFETGGFILDGGHRTADKQAFLPSRASSASPAPVLARYSFPDWKIALVIPEGEKVQGQREVSIFQDHCPISIDEVRALSHLILMKTLPSLVEEDINAFGQALNSIQEIGFKKIEVALQTPKVKNILQTCQSHSYGAGLSSFGPAICCIVDDENELLDAVGDRAAVILTKANNRGAGIT